MSESLQYSPVEEDNEYAVNLAASGSVADSPDPAPDDDDAPVNLSNGGNEELPPATTEPEEPENASNGLPYGGDMSFDMIYSEFVISAEWLPEDRDPLQHNPPETPGEDAYTYGADINAKLVPTTPGNLFNDGYLLNVTIRKPSAVGSSSSITGTFFSNGVAITNRLVVTDDYGNIYTCRFQEQSGNLSISIDSFDSSQKPVDLSALGLSFLPDNADSDVDLQFRYSYEVENEIGGWKQTSSQFTLIVDAVADKPGHMPGETTEVVIGPEDGTLAASGLTYENGMAVQVLGSAGQEGGNSTLFSLGSVTFGDYTDGSEQHYLLLAADDPALAWSVDPAALAQQENSLFVVPPSGEPATVWLDADGNKVAAGTPDAREYVRIDINNASLAAAGGTVDVIVPIIVSGSAENGVYQFDARACAEEMPTTGPNQQEVDPNNNFAVTNLDAVQVHVQNVEANIRISTGWAYESGAVAGGGANPDADPAGTGMADGQSSQTLLGVPHSAAPVRIAFTLSDDESLGQWITLSYDAGLGDMYFNGSRVNSTSGDTAFVTLPVDSLKHGELTAWFVPDPQSSADADFDLHYAFTLTKGTGDNAKTFTAAGDLPIVIDAVARPAAMNLGVSDEAPATDGFNLACTVTPGTDSAETHYLVISNPGGLLALGDLGASAAGLTQVTADELRAFEHADPAVGHHFDDLGADDIILRIDNPAGLTPAADGGITLDLPFIVTDRAAAGDSLNVSISTVVVEGKGNNAALWGQGEDREYDFANNIAVTDDTFTVHLARGGVTLAAPGIVYEGDSATHGGASLYGSPLPIAFDDAFEAVREISFTLSAADGSSAVDGAVTFGIGTDCQSIPTGGSLRLTAEAGTDAALYTGAEILNAAGEVIKTWTFPATTLEALVASGNASGLRFIPSGDGDADVVVDIAALTVTDTRSGDRLTMPADSLPSVTIVRDAVADTPQNVSTAVTPAEGYGAVVANRPVTLEIDAAFGDVSDGSEAHYLFISKDNLASVAIPAALASSLTLLADDAASEVCARIDGTGGIPGATAADYFIIRVGADALSDGTLNLSLGASLRADLTPDGNAQIDIRAVAVEHEGFLTAAGAGADNAEPTAANNVAVVEAPADIVWATLENVFTFTATPAAEDDLPTRHLPGTPVPAGGAHIRITPQDAGEVFDSLTISYADEEGNAASGSIMLYLDGQPPVSIASGTTLTFTHAAVSSPLCTAVSFTDADGTHTLAVPDLTLEEFSAQSLRYVPAEGSHGDTDVIVTFSGRTRETASGEEGDFAAHSVQIMVDAVADRPAGTTTDYNYGTDADGNARTALPEGSALSFAVNVDFADYEDGSEAHYLFINTKYFADDSLQLLTGDQAFAGGSPLTETDQEALLAQINGNPGLIPGEDDAYVVWKLDEAYLRAHNGHVSLTVAAALKDAAALDPIGPQKTPLDLNVKAVAVEHAGYLTPEADAASALNDETDATNNVAVTEVGTQILWDALLGQVDMAAETAWEDDRPGRHTGDDTAEGGANLTIAPQDASEVLTGLTLSYDASHGDLVLRLGDDAPLVLASGSELTFTFDATDRTAIVGLSVGGTALTVPGLTLAELTGQSLFYVPHDDNADADVTVNLTGRTLETNTGVRGETQGSVVIVTDAVADRPTDVTAELVVTHGKGDTVILNEEKGLDSFDLTLSAAFDDYADGSESHYFLVSGQYLASLSDLPEGISLLTAEDAAAVVDNAGLSGEYFVLDVPKAVLDAGGGMVNFTVTAHLDPASLPAEDSALHLDIRAAAIEHQGLNTPEEAELGNGHGQDALAANNVSLVDAGLDLHYARLDNDFPEDVVDAHEGDMPNQHQPNPLPVGGAAVPFAPADPGEVFDTLSVAYADGEGGLTLALPTLEKGNISLDLADGAQLAFVYRNDALVKEVTLTHDGESATFTLSPQLTLNELLGGERLRYTPDTASQSDADVVITFTGASRETATGESGGFSHAVTVRVDASADLPTEASGAAGNKQADRPALEPGKTFTLAVNANFGEDRADGSERHYLFISRDYLSALTVSESLAAAVSLLAATDAAAVCAQVDGAGGLPGASADSYFVLSVNDAWLRDHEGRIDLELDAVLKDAATLATAGAEGESLDLAMKAVAVEHQGFQTLVGEDLGNGHGQESRADNNVAVRDASAQFAYAVVDGTMTAEPAPAHEGDQPNQHTGDFATAGGAAVTLAPQDASEVFTELTLTCDAAHGELVLTAPDGTAVTLLDGARLVFTYDPAHPAQCLSVLVEQPDGTTAPVTLSYAGADGGGLSLAELTAGFLRYVPTTGDNGDADVTLSYAGTLLETASGATAPVEGNLTVTVDAVADLAQDAAGVAEVRDPAGGGSHSAAQPGETVTVSLRATFDDYADGSEAHYIFIAADHLPTLNGIPDGVTEVTASAALADIFSALATPGGTGIHAGTDAASNYHVLEVSAAFLEESEGHFSMQTTVTAGDVGIHHVEAAAVSVEYDGYRTAVADVDGSGVNRDATAENNVAVANMGFDIVVREFAPDRITVTPATEWAYENDRSEGDEAYHAPADESGRDNGVALIFSGQGEGNVITSVTFEYPMPSNGSAVPHEIRSSLGDDAVTISRAIADGVVTVTVSAVDPFGSVGDLRFIPGDNYDNDDVPVTVTHVDVADPALHQTTAGDPDWGSGVAPDGGQMLVKVDAVAQAPGLENFVVDHDSDNPVQAGGVIHITGTVSFEDTADGSESHFLLLEVLDGYYPDGVTLTHGAQTVTIPVTHYSAAPAQAANYTLQQLVTADDGQPHLFIKLPVDDALAALMGGTPLERMDGIALDVAYQTREWAAEGTSLHFAAIAAEDVESVREYDALWNITNDELPFDKQLEQYVPGLTVTDNNTAVTIAAQGAYVFWDESDSDVLNVRGYVFENDRPTDHQRDPAYILDRNFTDGQYDVVYSYPVSPDIEARDPVTGRDFGTGWELEIPDHTRQVSIAELESNDGNGSFYFLPETVWEAYMAQSPAPGSDAALAAYRVTPGGPAAVAQGDAAYTLVFIPSHGETGPSHKDYDYRFSYELLVEQYGSNGQLLGCKQYSGENVIRVDAVANQAELIAAGTTGEDQFSLWAGKDKTTAFDLTVGFHDLDGTEDHYILVETVPNFGFRCGDYTYVPGMDDSLLYTHVMTAADGAQTFIRYYKIPVEAADIDPATGRVTVTVEFVRQPGMPGVADYPASHELTYGALTEDRTTSRWDSQDPAAENFINRVGADGEYTYDNNTSVILRNHIEGGDPADGGNNPWNPGNITIVGGSGEEESGGGIIHWENGPGSGWSGGYWPGGNHEGGGGYWNPDGPAGGGGWWAEQGARPVGGSTSTEDWIPEGGGLWGQLPGGGGNIGGGSGGDEGGGSGGGAWYDNQWIASHQHGLAIEWVFENSTPLGHTEIGQYDRFMFTEIFLTGEVAGADSLKITIPDSVDNGLIVPATGSASSPWRFSSNEGEHPRATLYLLGSGSGPQPLSGVKGPDGWEFTVPAVNGALPAGQRLFLMVSPDSKGEDFALSAAWYSGEALLSAGSVDVLVDAVAQWANFGFADHADGVYGVTGANPAELIEVTVDAFFLDQDGSEANYLLVEKIPGVLPLHKGADGAYEPLREVYLDGRTYYRIAPTAKELLDNKITLQCSVNEDLLSPQHVEDLEHDGMSFSGVRLNVGTLTLEGQTGWAAAEDSPANWEFTLDNNTALNLREDALSFVISRVNAAGGDSSVTVKETADPATNRVRLDPADPAHGLNLSMDANDVLLALVFTGAAGNGSFWYEDENGISHPLPLNVDMKEAWLDGRIYYEQDRYQDADASLQWTADLRDGLSPNSDVTVSGALTVAVDAVAHAGEIHCGFPALDREAGTLTQTLRFDDFEANEQHYAVIAPDLYRVVGRQAQVRDGQGTWHAVAVETIFDPSGNPYYAVRLDGYLDADGAAVVRFALHELNIPGIDDFPVISGGVSVEPNAGYQAGDREPDLTDNWAINTRVDRVSEGVVSPVALALDVQDVTEDDPAGAAIALSGLPGENDALVAAGLVFSPAAGSAPLAGQPGDQIATIVYAGQCVAVTLMADGTAVAALDFGTGFDPAADFRLIWGIAHADADGQIVVSAWNHAANGSLTLQTDFTLSNRLSGLTATVSGTDADGITLLARADAPGDVSGGLSAVNGTAADPADPVGAAADAVTVTVSGSFADLDGSEAHYLLLEVPEGWQVSAPEGGTYETVAGTRYYRVSVDAAQAAPSVDMTLVSPDGLNGDVTLRTAAQAVEGNGHSAFAQGGDVTLHLSDVSATGLSAALGPVAEDGLLSLAPLGLADLAGNDGNDVLLAVTFTDLQGGDIVTADGAPVPLSPSAGQTTDQAGLTLTAEQLASGQYFYRPAPNYAGETDAQGRPLPVTLGYSALLGESNTGATAVRENLSLDLAVTPVADAPENVSAQSLTQSIDTVQTGHKAVVVVRLTADFADADGSEEHFFLLSGPQGVTVAPGAGYELSLLTAGEIPALNLPDGFPTANAIYKLTLTDGTAASPTLDVNLDITTTLYNGGSLHLVGGSSERLADGGLDQTFSGVGSVSLPAAVSPGIGNTSPVADASGEHLDTLRHTDVEGTVSGSDADGDSLEPASLSFGATQGTQDALDGRDCLSVHGDHGTLYLFADNTYRYVLDAGKQGVTGTEVFTYALSDDYGGLGEAHISITLEAPNTAPAASAFAAELDSVRQTTVGGVLSFQDAENDAVTVAAVNGVTDPVNLGSEAEPRMGFRVTGGCGTLEVWESDGQWRYGYVLAADHRGETEDEQFTLTLRDAYGMESAASLTVDLFNVNAAPVAGAATAVLDTLRDADRTVGDALAVSDADNDAVSLAGAQGHNGAAGQPGTDDRGQPALVVAGQYGTLYLYQAQPGAPLSYRYVLGDEAAATGVEGTETFTYTVDDGYLGTGVGSLVITLDRHNTPPVIAGELGSELDTLRDADRIVTGALTFSDADSHPDQGRDPVSLAALSFGETAGTADGQGGYSVNGAYGVFHIDASGLYTYTLSPEHAGVIDTESFGVTVTDAYGASRTETVTIDLLVRNADPAASSPVVSLNTWRGGGEVSDQVELTDADNDPVRISAVSGVNEGVWGVTPEGDAAFVASGQYGTLYLRQNGSFDYVLNAEAQGVSGTDAFSFSVEDGFGGTASGAISINLDNANAAPVISGDISADIGGGIDQYEGGIVRESGTFSWSDADGDAVAAVSVGGETLPVSGSVEVEGRYGVLVIQTAGECAATWTYTLRPGLDAEGITDEESFDILIRDVYGAESAQSLTIQLAPLSHAPQCEDVGYDWPMTPDGTPISYLDGALSFHDEDTGYNPDETLSLSVNGTVVADQVSVAGQYGSLTIHADGSFRYTTDYTGEDLLETFTYTVTDAAGNSDEAHLYIRLSDNAPAFPGTGTGDAAADAFFADAPGTGGEMPGALPEPPEPLEVTLIGVPLPYDADALQAV